MANHKSAEKRARQTIKKTNRNKSIASEVKTIIKKVRNFISAKDKASALKMLPSAQALIQRLAQKGFIKKNTAARKTSRLASQISKL